MRLTRAQAEDALAVRRVDADAVVADEQHRLASLPARAHLDERLLLVAQELHRVLEQVLDDLHEARAVTQHDRKVLRDAHLRAALGDAAGHERRGFVGQLAERDRLGRPHDTPDSGQLQQLVHEARHALGGVLDALDVELELLGVARQRVALDEGEEALDGHERALQVVGGGVGEAFELRVLRVQLPDQRLAVDFGALSLGDVLHGAVDPGQALLGCVPDRVGVDAHPADLAAARVGADLRDDRPVGLERLEVAVVLRVVVGMQRRAPAAPRQVLVEREARHLLERARHPVLAHAAGGVHHRRERVVGADLRDQPVARLARARRPQAGPQALRQQVDERRGDAQHQDGQQEVGEDVGPLLRAESDEAPRLAPRDERQRQQGQGHERHERPTLHEQRADQQDHGVQQDRDVLQAVAVHQQPAGQHQHRGDEHEGGRLHVAAPGDVKGQQHRQAGHGHAEGRGRVHERGDQGAERQGQQHETQHQHQVPREVLPLLRGGGSWDEQAADALKQRGLGV